MTDKDWLWVWRLFVSCWFLSAVFLFDASGWWLLLWLIVLSDGEG